jgi:proteasome lid subunit RPN8/RPN11
VQRVEVESSLPPVEIPKRIVLELLGHARETLGHPGETPSEECCGLIVGSAAKRFRRLVRCRNEMTQRHRADPVAFPLDGQTAFWMSEADYMHTREEAEAAGERVTAIYHSHVGSGAYLSELDLEYAQHALFPFPDADQIVVAVASPDAGHLGVRLDDDECVHGIGIFQWDAAARAFRGHRVRPSAS